MTLAMRTSWQVLRDNKPVHNGYVYAVAPDGTVAPNYLDPECTQRGADKRRTNAWGWMCNSAADGKACGMFLKPGAYTLREEDENGAPLGEFQITITEAQTMTVLNVNQIAAPTADPANINFAVHTAAPNRERPLAEDEAALRFKVPPGSNIAGAIKDLISIAEPGSKPER